MENWSGFISIHFNFIHTMPDWYIWTQGFAIWNSRNTTNFQQKFRDYYYFTIKHAKAFYLNQSYFARAMLNSPSVEHHSNIISNRHQGSLGYNILRFTHVYKCIAPAINTSRPTKVPTTEFSKNASEVIHYTLG